MPGSIHYRLSTHRDDHPGACRRCDARIVTRSGLIGTSDDRPLCETCLLEAAPPVGWALNLAERVAGATAGRWPSTSDGDELASFFEFLDFVRSFGPLVPENLKVQIALGILAVVEADAEHLAGRIHARLEELAERRGVEIDLEELTVDKLSATLEKLDERADRFFLGVLKHARRTDKDRGACDRLEHRIGKP